MNHTPDQKSVHKPVQDFALPQRSTKIVATLGPASSDLATLERMFQAGVDVVRLNFSHGTAEDHALRVERVREAGARTGRTVAIMGDLQGPKIRVGKFRDGKVTLAPASAAMSAAHKAAFPPPMTRTSIDITPTPL